MKVGIDIIDIERMDKFAEDMVFQKKNFTDYEIEYIGKKLFKDQTLAGLYSAKEAFLKALGIGIFNGLQLKEIEIKHDSLGKPYFVITEKILGFLNKEGLTKVDLSISHTKTNATAICVMM